MYTVTFYSYKGGVGRTMGLTNVAWELARRGRKVLIVDFDLEAPGITSFDFCKPIKSALGLVDYISTYNENLAPPEIQPYIHRCVSKYEGDEVGLWVMPAGRQDSDYKRKFHSINWDSLYSEKSGFLMIENLKEQWADYIKPDYVLIDSRTGHTDISGICTRQLPDAVVFSFFPNRQNLSGLSEVVAEVKSEAQSPRRKQIRKHFVASNIPDVDDEYGILSDHLKEFQTALGYKKLNKVHYYNNLSIMDQQIFTLCKPKTKLAGEYVALTNNIIKENTADEEGVLKYLDDSIVLAKKSYAFIDADQVTKISAIRREHPESPAVHAKLSDLLMRLGRNTEAVTEAELALKLDPVQPDVLANLGFLYRQMNRLEEARAAFLRLGREFDSDDTNVYYSIMQLADFDSAAAREIIDSESALKLSSTAITALEGTLRTKRNLIPLAIQLLIRSQESESLSSALPSIDLVLCYIAVGDFGAAINALGGPEAASTSTEIVVAFNYAIADWGLKGAPVIESLERVLLLHEAENKDATTPNYAQCMGLVTWALGQKEVAKDWIHTARNLANDRYKQWYEFSCWSYLNANMAEFISDLEKMELAIDGGDRLAQPEFLTQGTNRT